MTTDPSSGTGFSAGPSAPPPPQPRRELHRSSSDKVVAGVCGGLGRYTGIDPVVFRVTLGVLAVFAGIGIALYGLAWLLIPAEGTHESEAQRLLHGRGSAGTVIAVIAAIVGASLLIDVLRDGVGHSTQLLLVLAAIVAVVTLLRRGNHTGNEPGPPPGQAAAPGATAPPAAGTTVGAPAGAGAAAGVGAAGSATESARTAGGETTEYVNLAAFGPTGTAAEGPAGPTAQYLNDPSMDYPTPPGATALWTVEPGPPAPRPSRVLTPLTVSVTLVVVGVLLGLQASGNLSIPVAMVLAAALVVIGAGLVVGSWRGRGRGLIPIGALLAGGLIATATLGGFLRGVPVDGGWGERTWSARSASSAYGPYRLAGGNAHLDLSDLALAGGYRTIDASVAFGQLVVTVPGNVDVVVQAHAGAGALKILGVEAHGTQVDRTVTVPSPSSPTAGTVHLILQVGLGSVEVNYAKP